MLESTTRYAQERLRLLLKDYGSAEGREKPKETKKPEAKKVPFLVGKTISSATRFVGQFLFYRLTAPLRTEEAQNTLVWVMGSDSYQITWH
jgi:hypothetical protein